MTLMTIVTPGVALMVAIGTTGMVRTIPRLVPGLRHPEQFPLSQRWKNRS